MTVDLDTLLPAAIGKLDNPQTDIPRIAKEAKLTAAIEGAIRGMPTSHQLYLYDARDMSAVESESVHLIVTSPPYWTLKEYRRSEGQLGYVEDYESFLSELDKVWTHCLRVLVPGGRLICVVGDVCLSRRKNEGRDVTPFDYAFEANNINFLKSGGFKTRDGFTTLLEASTISITGSIVQFWQIKNLNGVPRANRWLVLTWDGTDGRIYDTGVTSPATNPILTINNMKYAFVLNAFNRMYISPWEDWGVPLKTTTTTFGGVYANNIFVYNGLYNARIAH